MNESTIRTIRTNENTIRKIVAAWNTTSMGTTSYTRNIAVEKMEKALMLWIEDQTQNFIEKKLQLLNSKIMHFLQAFRFTRFLLENF